MPDRVRIDFGHQKGKTINSNSNSQITLSQANSVCEICGCQITADDVFEHECDFEGILAAAPMGEPYLEPIELDGGGYRQRDIIHACGSSVIRFRGTLSDKRYFKRLYCMKPYCPSCNRKRGRIEKKRIQAVYKRLPHKLKGMFLRQWVLTVPDTLRSEFQTKDRLNQLCRSATRIMKQFYAGKGWIDYIHIVGEEGEFNPHINVHIPETYKDVNGQPTGEKWMETEERIDAIKRRWKMALAGIVGHKIDAEIIVAKYSFRKTRWHMRHAIKYMARANFNLQDDVVDFMADYLKGFQYLRFGGTMRNGTYKDDGINRRDLEEKAGERLQFEEIIAQRDVDLLYKSDDLEEIAPGLFRETDKAYYQRTHKQARG